MALTSLYCRQLWQSIPLSKYTSSSCINSLSYTTKQLCSEQQQSRNRHFSTHVGAPLRKKITTVDIQKFRNQNKPITMCTAYTYPSAVHVDQAGIDILLVGDSLSMVELGHDTTLPITVDQLIYHTQAVCRGAQHPLIVSDLPFGSYESSAQQAYHTATRFLKETSCDSIKLEGGETRASTVSLLCDGGIAVMGHIGLTPQRVSILGGFRAQGKSIDAATQLIKDAIALEQAGAFALVIECVPAIVAKYITEAVSIPTIGIGAGKYTNGQVLVYHDMLGFFQHAHHAAVTPKFVKKYGNVGQIIQQGLEQYKSEVENNIFPGDTYSPYKISGDVDKICEKLDETVKQLKRSSIPSNITGSLNVQQATDSDSNSSGTNNTTSDNDTIKLY